MGQNPIEDVSTSSPASDVPKRTFESAHQQQPLRESPPSLQGRSRRLNSERHRGRWLLKRTECVNKALLYLRIAALLVAVPTLINAALALARTTGGSDFDERLRHNALAFTGCTVALGGLVIVVETIVLTGIFCLHIELMAIDSGLVLMDALLSIVFAVGFMLGSVAMAILSHQWSVHDPAWGINSVPFTLASAAVFGLLDFILYFIHGISTLVLAISKCCILPKRALTAVKV